MNIIRITRPEPPAAERAKRMEAIKEASDRLITSTEQKRRNNGKHHQGL